MILRYLKAAGITLVVTLGIGTGLLLGLILLYLLSITIATIL